LTGILFLIAILSLIAVNSTSSPIENNWLVLLYKINAGYAGFQFDRLQGVRFIDVLILILAVFTFLGIAAAHQGAARLWSIVSTVLPFLGYSFY